ncbi:MAG: hypothetical protein MUF38_11435, partial [Anaerolineae bacterium]|nr:hypothetical protein [Anaerolineae bacterium]
DEVGLEFEQDALEAAAELSIKRETGARGLRSIIEHTLMDVMFEVPSRTDIQKVVITADAIHGRARPLLVGKNGSTLPWESIPQLAAQSQQPSDNDQAQPAA